VTDRLVADRLAALIEQRSEANRRFFKTEAERLARLCHLMAERFARGGRLVALGSSPGGRSDARHVAVEFVHPVIVGKRALPAIGLAAEGGALDRQLELLARSDDMAMAFGPGLERAVAVARERGCLTIGFGGSGAEWEFAPPTGEADIAQELVETLYHVLWELVHVFFEHRGLLTGRDARRTHDAGASSFLYPFLAEQESNLDAVLDDVRQSVLMKAQEIGALREQTLIDNGDELFAAASALRGVFEAGGKVLALGNGGSATDAMDLVADLHAAGRPAIDLTEDAPILTAIANDIGVDAIFSRQVIAYGLTGDALVSLSTSGNSLNVIAALGEARKRDMVTVAFVGYDGGRIGAERLADHVIVTRSEHIPRIQEAQAGAYHALCALLG
jgi:D-sedoheptulose 7-phosphate isomerase